MDLNNYNQIVSRANNVQKNWQKVPAPKRGEVIRSFGNKLREHKSELAALITKDARKIISEAEGEVQEAIDMCDFATGLSRQLYGLTMPSERPNHRLQELWHPLGTVGCITAFNFPMAVFAWNFCLASVCGNSTIWKPSPHANSCAHAMKKIWNEVSGDFNDLCIILEGGKDEAVALCQDRKIHLISATGSCQMGMELAPIVGARMGKTLFELGGNNAGIVCASADVDLAIKAITFSAAGTSGQRCTSMRRLFVHEDIFDTCIEKLKISFANLVIGDPNNSATQLGPLISENSFKQMQASLSKAKDEGALIIGGERLNIESPSDFYVQPAICIVDQIIEVMKEETFAPILYIKKYKTLGEAINYQNDVNQGLSSAIFTNDVRESEYFLSAEGSDCGIANVNIGTSGAEIGGAFGGEKDTGGGRESGSDAWKAYMRRVTATVNFGSELPLAQGVEFDDE